MAMLAIFDLDGTLIDTTLMTARALRELTGRFGLAMPPEPAIRDAMGLHDPEFYRALFPGAPAPTLAGLSAAVERREGEIGAELGAGILFPGVAGMLKRLRDNGATLCLASTGSRVHVEDMLNCAAIRGLFSGIRCYEPDKTRMTAALLARYGAEGAAFAGDTAIDAAAARNNGIPVYGAGFGYVKARERALFDAVAETPDQLAALLLGE